jgi:hypothetical protein
MTSVQNIPFTQPSTSPQLYYNSHILSAPVSVTAMKLTSETASPRVVLTAADTFFDQDTVQLWQDEGFHVIYLPCTGTRKEFEQRLQLTADSLELGEKYAIVGLLPRRTFLQLSGRLLGQEVKV